MNSIEALKLDFKSQIRELGNINNKKICDDCVFVGSGDSYVAGLIVEYLTAHRCRCYTPSDLIRSRILDDKTYCFISVTGRTKANIELARFATESGVRTIAVTANQNSKLAEVCKEVVPLELAKANGPTTGFSAFVANIVTCLQIAGITVPKKLDNWHKKGIELSLTLLDSTYLPSKLVYLLGNNILYPVALYASLKMLEFFGTTAIAHKLEEFCHSPIFGIKKSHDVWILGHKEEQVKLRLEKLGIHLNYFELYNPIILTELFQSIFFVQKLILLLAERQGCSQLHYLVKEDILKASSDLIYDNPS